MLPAPVPPPAAVAAAPAAPPASPRYGFDQAWLGESLADWRASRPARATAACPAVPAQPSLVVCRGPDVDVGGGFAARELSYVFVDGRLARISFRTSIDGFDYVTAALKKTVSAPAAIVRDSLGRTDRPHVAITWRNGHSTIMLSDPTPDAAHLSVRFTLDALAGQAAKAG